MIKSGFSPKALTQCVCVKLIFYTFLINCKIFTSFVETFRCTYSSKKGYKNKIGFQGNEASLFF